MKKQLVIIGIVALLVTVGFSGCTDTKKELTPANIILKNVTYSPSKPVTNEEIIFTITLENKGDRDDFRVITLNGTDRYTGNFTLRSGSFIIDGHSQKNVTISTAEHIINEGIQSFEIGINGNQPIRTINIDIQPGSPDIYHAVTGYIAKLNNNTYIENTTFTVGDVVILFYLYRNVNHEGKVETYHNITIYHEGVLYYSDADEYKTSTDNETFQVNFPFDVEGSWPKGEYQIEIEIQDKITGLTSTKEIYFTVV
jgi:Tfp pilus assembly protein FimT